MFFKKKNNELTLFGKLVEIHYEQAKRRKALRTLVNAEWSVEFLTEVVRSAAKHENNDVILEIETKQGHKIRISSAKKELSRISADDDIFNNLDNDAAIESFIMKHQPTR